MLRIKMVWLFWKEFGNFLAVKHKLTKHLSKHTLKYLLKKFENLTFTQKHIFTAEDWWHSSNSRVPTWQKKKIM
jgi:hypothetical protein